LLLQSRYRAPHLEWKFAGNRDRDVLEALKDVSLFTLARVASAPITDSKPILRVINSARLFCALYPGRSP
jgi:hypothetical protein